MAVGQIALTRQVKVTMRYAHLSLKLTVAASERMTV